MKRGQISIDMMFAILLIMVTVLNVISLGISETSHANTFDTITRVKTLAVSLSNHVAKIYSAGVGFSLKETAPNMTGIFNITFLNKNLINVTYIAQDKTFWTIQNSTVPLCQSSVVVRGSQDFWLVVNESGGRVCVEIKS